jgi:multiple sugar transport system permease protein
MASPFGRSSGETLSLDGAQVSDDSRARTAMALTTPVSKEPAVASIAPAGRAAPGVWRLSIARLARPSWNRARQRVFLVFLGPSLLVLFLVTILPLIFLLATSLTSLDMSNPASLRWAGLTNYREVTRDGRFWNSVWIQAQLSFWTVSLQVVIGFAIALLLNGRLKLLGLVRATFIVPMVLPPVVVALIWKVLFTPDISILDWTLGLLGLPQPAWLVDPRFALWAIIIADVWEWFPFVMLMLLAALQMLPQEPQEAARLDGASRWQSFWYVTLPLVKPALVVATVFRLIDSVKAFPHIFIMTGGGPGTATEVTNFYAYLEGFSYTYVGYASAIIVVMLGITLLMSLVALRVAGWEVEVE